MNEKKGNKNTTVIKPGTTDGSILGAMFKAYGGPFWFAGLLQIALNCLTFASPLLLNQLITYTVPGIAGPLWQGLVLTFALFLCTFLSSIFNGQYFLKTFVVGFRIRSGLISAIYRKSLRISSAAKKDTTVGEIVNLMAVDAQRFFELVSYLVSLNSEQLWHKFILNIFQHVLWSGPVVIGVAIWLLWEYLGIAVLAGLGVMLLMVPLSGVIAAKLRDLQIVQMKVKDERVKSMNEVLNGMKVLKLYAWEPSFEKLILGTREKEMVVLKKAALYNAGTYFVWSLAPFLVSLASYITFVLMGGILTPNVAFVSFALFNVLRFPMAMCKLFKCDNFRMVIHETFFFFCTVPMMIALVMQAL